MTITEQRSALVRFYAEAAAHGGDDYTSEYVALLIGVDKSTIKRYCRRLHVKLADYTPRSVRHGDQAEA
jgi:hypothetical protein